MDISRLDMPERVSYLVENSTEWIRSQRVLHTALSQPLPDTTRQALLGYFEPETLDRTRFRRVPGIDNPGFYAEFERVGESIPLDFSSWAAITFGEVILVNESLVPTPPPHSVVFHEMVHVVQYDVLGIEEFSRRYVRRLAQTRFQYMNIPLETEAFDLQGRFERSAGEIFSAEALIRGNLATPRASGATPF
jgi:hypothetical protein